MTAMDELKPCPVCGISPHMGYCCAEYFVAGEDPLCPVCGNTFTEMHSSEEAEVMAWNKRVDWWNRRAREEEQDG